MRRRTTLGDRNLVGENIIRIRAEKKMSQGELLSQIQLFNQYNLGDWNHYSRRV